MRLYVGKQDQGGGGDGVVVVVGFCLFCLRDEFALFLVCPWPLHTQNHFHTPSVLLDFDSANSSKMPPQSNGDVSSAGSSGAMGDQQQHQERHALSATVSISTTEIPVIDLENPDTSLLIDQVSVRLRMATWK